MRALLADGFILTAGASSHRRYRHPDGRRVTVAYQVNSVESGHVLHSPTILLRYRVVAIRQRQELQLWHGEMLLVVGHEHKLVGEGHGGDGHVGVGESLTLLPPLAEEITGELGDLLRHRVEFQAPLTGDNTEYGQSSGNKIEAPRFWNNQDEIAIRSLLADGFEASWNSHQPARTQ